MEINCPDCGRSCFVSGSQRGRVRIECLNCGTRFFADTGKEGADQFESSVQPQMKSGLPNTSTLSRPATKRCPFCGEEILSVAIKCKHCGEFLNGKSPSRTGSTGNSVSGIVKMHFSAPTIIRFKCTVRAEGHEYTCKQGETLRFPMTKAGEISFRIGGMCGGGKAVVEPGGKYMVKQTGLLGFDWIVSEVDAITDSGRSTFTGLGG